MIMKVRLGNQLRPILIFASIILLFGLTQDSYGVEPCPVVAETTLAQKAAQWVTAFQKPYCDHLNDYSISIVKQRFDPGVFHLASSASQIFKASGAIGESDGPAALSRLSAVKNLKSTTLADMAAVKLSAVRADTAITAYASGKKAFSMASQIDLILSGFSPTSFDFVSKHQTHKDTAKLAHLRGLVQSQELRLVSLMKMLDSLAEGK